MKIRYCPNCGNKLKKEYDGTEGWTDCPKCGDIHIEVWK